MICKNCGIEQRHETIECMGVTINSTICNCGKEYPPMDEQRHLAYWNDCKVPPETRDWLKTLKQAEDDENRAALEMARDYCRNLGANMAGGRGLVFLGTPGTMKTVIMSSILKYACDHDISCRWIGYRKIVKIITDESYREDMAEELDRIARYKLVLIDDVGCEPLAPWQKVHIAYLIDQRFERKLPTLYTANLTDTEISERLGSDIWSRINGTCKVLVVAGKDRRAK